MVSSLFLLVVYLAGAQIVRVLGQMVVAKLQTQRRRALFEASAEQYLHALRALVRSGLGFSAALDRLAHAQATPFSQAMRGRLRVFAQGGDFLDCLDRFPSRGSALLGLCLENLASAYRQGLAILPLLDRMVPALEFERAQNQRLRELRRSVLWQVAVAASVPWIVVGVLRAVGPAGVGRLTIEHAVGVLVWEGVGIWTLWKQMRFL